MIEKILVQDFDDQAFRKFYFKYERLCQSQEIIPIVIHSYGGDVEASFGIIDLIDARPDIIFPTICIGVAYSAAVLLLMSGTKGYRYASQNSNLMIHDISTLTEGKGSDIANDAKHIEEIQSLCYKMIKEKTKIADIKDFLIKHGNLNWFFSAKIAKQYGIIDKIGIPNFVNKVDIS